MGFEVKKWEEGSREDVGKAYGCLYRGKFYAVLLTYAGAHRGNHIHPNKQSSILLSGKARYVKKKGDELITIPLEVGRCVEVEAGIPHILLAEEDTLTFEWWDGEFKAEPYKVLDV